MLMAHVATLAEARSSLAALADHAQVFEASVEYERFCSTSTSSTATTAQRTTRPG